MKLLILLVALAGAGYTKIGTGPICGFDGAHMQCVYWSWEDCAAGKLENQRCVANPEG